MSSDQTPLNVCLHLTVRHSDSVWRAEAESERSGAATAQLSLAAFPQYKQNGDFSSLQTLPARSLGVFRQSS